TKIPQSTKSSNEDEEAKERGEIEDQDDLVVKDVDLMLYEDLDEKKEPAAQTELLMEPVSNALFIKSIPPQISRKELKEAFEKIEGFECISLSDPVPNRKFHRFGWIVFKDSINLTAANDSIGVLTLHDFTFHIAPQQATRRFTKIIPFEFNDIDRVRKDINQIKELALALDAEVGINSTTLGAHNVQIRLDDVVLPELTSSNEEVSELALEKKTLDMYTEYLRKVHWYDYYSGYEAQSLEDFTRRCVAQYRQAAPDITENNAYKKKLESLELRTHLRITRPTEGPEFEKLGGKKLEVEIEKKINSVIKVVDEGKYRCPVATCKKLFKATEYLVKHIRGNAANKVIGHPELFESVPKDVSYFNKFILDQNNSMFVQPPLMPTGQNMMNNGWIGVGMPGYTIPMMNVPSYGMRGGGGGGYNMGGSRGRSGGGRGGGYGGREQWEMRETEKLEDVPRERRQLDPRSANNFKTYVDLDKPASGSAPPEMDISYD
ncbi:hypothetical protein HK096_005604, partial [Nowakowskiella sp. JEL0078]